MENFSNVGECKKELDFLSNEMSDNRGLGIDLQEMCISRKKTRKRSKTTRSARLKFVLLLREGDTAKILNFLDCELTRSSIQLEINAMGSNGFGNVENYYQKLKKRWNEFGH
ncbi:MAG: hypothetical protein KC646_10175 [Candidatus Cloacimonetes bacterium]|nr:hypothetical protein [Candidatus Cloacimonadota bacterium]